jgi:hypothetical protein
VRAGWVSREGSMVVRNWGVRQGMWCGRGGERYHVETGVEVAGWVVFAYEWVWHFDGGLGGVMRWK